MDKSENFKDYPKILKIEKDGKIIGLDKNGAINTDFNTNNISDEEFYREFGIDCETLHDRYVTENLSRLEKNKNSYNEDATPNTKPTNFYNERDLRRELDQQNEIKKSKSKAKWLGLLLVIAIIVIAVFVVKNQFSNNDQEDNQLANENEQLQQDIDDTKSQLQNSQQNEQATQQQINELQNKIDSLKTNDENQNANNELQNGINQLQEAQNNKVNGNKEEMAENLKKVDDVIDTEKISEQGKNQWEKFKNWLDENISW